MGKLLEELLKYLSSTSPEQLEKNWKEIEPYSQIGPTAEEFVKQSLGMFKYSFNKVKEASVNNNNENPEFTLGFCFN